MSNVVDLATIRAIKQGEAEQRALQVLIENLDQEAYRPGPEDKYFDMRMRDAVLDYLRRRGLIDDQHLGMKTATKSFILNVAEDNVLPGREAFDALAERIALEITGPIGYLHSVMIAKPSYEWSVMIRYYLA